MNKAIQYREDGKFYGLVSVPNPEHFKDDGVSSWNRERYLRYMESCISAGKEIINPEVLPIHKQWTGELQKLYLKYHGLLKPGHIFDCPNHIEFEEDQFCAYHNLNCSYCGTCAGSCYKPKKVIRLKLKEEVKPVETQDELWHEAAVTFMSKYYMPAMEENKSKFTIQRNKNGNE